MRLRIVFLGLYDRGVLIDFTLEEDGYNPVFLWFRCHGR